MRIDGLAARPELNGRCGVARLTLPLSPFSTPTLTPFLTPTLTLTLALTRCGVARRFDVAKGRYELTLTLTRTRTLALALALALTLTLTRARARALAPTLTSSGGADAVGLDAAVLALARALCEAGAAPAL